MMHKIGRATFLLSFVMVLVNLSPSAHAQHCSSAQAAGNYAFSDSGQVINVGPRAAVGLITFNAAGQIHGQVTASLNGGITQMRLSGTYTVNPDCSGAANFGEFDQAGNPILTATVFIAWDDNMQHARFIFTSVVLADGPSLSIAVNGEARKLVP